MYCSAQDFAVGLATLLHGSPEERLRWTFDLYDVDKVVVCTVYCTALYCSGAGRAGEPGRAAGGDRGGEYSAEPWGEMKRAAAGAATTRGFITCSV